MRQNIEQPAYRVRMSIKNNNSEDLRGGFATQHGCQRLQTADELQSATAQPLEGYFQTAGKRN
jgi:hypothetical protein